MKSKKRMIFTVILMAFFSFSCLTVSISYAFLSRIKVSNNTQVITTGNLNSTISYEPSNTVILGTMSDSQGLNQTDMAVVSITKDNIYSVFYTVDISYSVDSIPVTKTVSDLIPLEYVRVALFNDASNDPIAGPVSITDLPLKSVDENSLYNDKYTLSYGMLNSGVDYETFRLKAWLDPAISSEFDSYVIYLELHVDQEPLLSRSLYNISGVVSSGGNPVNGALVSIQNGATTAITASNGTYTLSNVPTGTYTLTVTNGDNKYETTINIRYDQTISLSTIGPNTGSANTYLQNSAFTYYTTPGRILRNNSLTINTNQQSNSIYAIPASYVLTGLESISVLAISNLNMALSNTDTLTLTLS